MPGPRRLVPNFSRVATAWLPFADAASQELPLGRLLRLALFQVSVGMTMVLLNGTLNRVMIVELGTPAWLVAPMIALPVLIAPFRALIGHRSDMHRSALGWRRVPYIWFGTLLQFAGLAIMPFALLLTSAPATAGVGILASAVAFLLAGAGLHTTQTAGLALATDLAQQDKRGRAVALLYVMLLAGMMLASLVIGSLLADFQPTRLVQVIQGAAMLVVILNIVALWKQEGRGPAMSALPRPRTGFAEVWRGFVAQRRTRRLLVAIGLGAAGFAMQDALLEPYGGEVLGLSVGATTALTGAWALGTLAGLAIVGRKLDGGAAPLRLAGYGLVAGVVAFLLIIFAAPMQLPAMLALGSLALGAGVGLFSVGTLLAAMALSHGGASGIALGAWGAVQASATGLAIAFGGVLRDLTSQFAAGNGLGPAVAGPATGYTAVYLLEILLLLLTLAIIGPLVRREPDRALHTNRPAFGLSEFPT